MAHVGVESLGPRHGQNHATHCQKGIGSIIDKEINGINWVEGGQNFGVVKNMDKAHSGNGDEPDTHNRPKEPSHF